MSELSVVIPSYNRSSVLLETINYLLQQTLAAAEIIVVDQTRYAGDEKEFSELQTLEASNTIRWLRLDQPSIPAAMNCGLLHADSDNVLFLDDDITVESGFLAAHMAALATHNAPAQVGQVLQPDQVAISHTGTSRRQGLSRDLDFAFNSTCQTDLYNCMAGNLCVRRQAALAAGGFDENFVGVAYRFETEFCRRLIRYADQPVKFTPAAVLHHLQYQIGGTRAHANHLTSSSGTHSMGDYYFALLESKGSERWTYIIKRLSSSWVAKFYLVRPWFIPIRLVAEFRGLWHATKVYRHGQRLINSRAGRS